MKKSFALIIIASIFLFLGASPWEGSAAVAPNGDLPATGFYIATNAFPRNTVVEITNIENGKSTSAIVSNNLTSPGLLAVVSREAAELIGMRTGSISRIRLIQPSDPMAYSRFSERMSVDTPEYDSGNVINEEKLVEQVYDKDTYTPPEVVTSTPTPAPAPEKTPVPDTPPTYNPETPAKTATAPGYIVDEPEWGGIGRLQIVDVPGYMVEPSITEPANISEQPSVTQAQPVIEPENVNEPTITEPEKETEVAQATLEPEPQQEVVVVEEKPVIDETPEVVAEAPSEEVKEEEIATAPEPEPQEEIAIVETTPQPEPEPEKLPEQLTLVETTPNPPPSNVLDIFPDDFISGIGVATPEKTEEPKIDNAPIAENLNPSIRTIDRLDRGKYYVQVAALSADMVENMLKQIDSKFAPVVFRGADNVYRILIGPLNQGESAAILVRFKSIGYKDAFVRKGS